MSARLTLLYACGDAESTAPALRGTGQRRREPCLRGVEHMRAGSLYARETCCRRTFSRFLARLMRPLIRARLGDVLALAIPTGRLGLVSCRLGLVDLRPSLGLLDRALELVV